MADSYIAKELENILGDQNQLGTPVSRIAKILMKFLDESTEIEAPQSVIGDLLLQIYNQGLVGALEEKTLTPDFSSGNVVLTPDEGYKGFSQVEIDKDVTLIPENVKKDITIHGIVGTFEGGGGAAEAELRGIVERTLTSIDDDICESIGNYAFYSYTTLLSAIFRKATSIGNSAFSSCSSLTTVDFPEVTSISSGAFSSCSSLTTVDFPEVTSISSGAFSSCNSLTTVDFPKVTSINNSSFSSCSSLTTVDFPKVANIDSFAFSSCSSLNVIVLRKTDTICTLSNINAFNYTPFASGGTGGTLYVPQALIASYQANTRWATILGYPNNQIKAIEGSIYE